MHFFFLQPNANLCIPCISITTNAIQTSNNHGLVKCVCVRSLAQVNYMGSRPSHEIEASGHLVHAMAPKPWNRPVSRKKRQEYYSIRHFTVFHLLLMWLFGCYCDILQFFMHMGLNNYYCLRNHYDISMIFISSCFRFSS